MKHPTPITCLALAAGLGLASPAAAQRPGAGDVIEGSYIVAYEKSVRDAPGETRARERDLGFRSRHRYRRALEGFAAKLSRDQVKELRADPDVDYVTPTGG